MNAGDQSVQFFVFQEEMETTTHFQGYAEFKRATRLRGVKLVFGMRCHLDRRAGSQTQAIAYCTKERTRVDGGLAGKFGTRKRRAGKPKGSFGHAVELLMAGESMEAVRDEHPEAVAMYPDKLNDFAVSLMGERDWAMDIEIYVGVTGTGKSTTAKLENPGCYHAPWPSGGRWWWPAYSGQECVVMDEFMHQIKLGQMMDIMDRHPIFLEAKGRNFQFVSKKLVITTNIDPCDWYPNCSLLRKDPLARRIKQFADIYDFAPGHDYPDFVKVLRTVDFVFHDVARDDYSY